jgi:UDP-N-acetylglucosamine 1-carboxyvinyltransferase
MDDRIEIGTYLTAVTMTKGKIEIKCSFSKILETIIDKLKISGANITFNEECIELEMDQKPNPVNISTAPFPLFPTDMQAQFIALNSISTGKSKVVENVFENRFMHVQELIRMGGDINLQGNTATITGSKAGLVAKGQTKVDRIYHIDRGYERIEEKLNLLGANIERVSE